jgi:hypothetical protein
MASKPRRYHLSQAHAVSLTADHCRHAVASRAALLVAIRFRCVVLPNGAHASALSPTRAVTKHRVAAR